MYDDVTTRNENGELAVRTVSATEGSNTSSYDDIFTRTEDGKLAMRVVGSGGSGDQHNLGYFATPAALEEAYPTAEAGDWAIVGSTDTVWLWDTDNSEWVDSDQKGQVTSVNGQTGAVTVSEVPSQTGYSGRVLGTDGFVAGWVVPEKVQRSTMPQASEEEVDNIYQYVGTTDANYTNGYFYKCVSDGQDPATYSWTRVDVQPTPSGLPDQTGQSGKFLTTDGTDASWSDKPLVNTSTSSGLGIGSGSSADYISNFAVGINAKAIGSGYGTCVGNSTQTGNNAVAVGYNAKAKDVGCVAIGHGTDTNFSRYGIAIGAGAKVNGNGAIQFNGSSSAQTNSDANTMKVANANGNYEIMSADGTIPADRLTHAINKYSTMPTAASTNEGWIVQFTGTTDSTYTHGHLYECVSDGADPATYSWTEVSMGGGSSYTAGTGIDITNDVISVTAPTLQNNTAQTDSVAILGTTDTTYGYNSVSIGSGSHARTNSVVIGKNAGNLSGDSAGDSVFIGYNTKPRSSGLLGIVAIGANAQTGAYGIAIGGSANASGGNSIAIGSGATSSGSSSVKIGYGTTSGEESVAFGNHASVSSNYGIALGSRAVASAVHAIQIGRPDGAYAGYTNSDANTFKVGNANGNFEIMSADGTIPEARLADTTNAQQGDVLTLDSNGNAVWQAGGGGSGEELYKYPAGTYRFNKQDVLNKWFRFSVSSDSVNGGQYVQVYQGRMDESEYVVLNPRFAVSSVETDENKQYYYAPYLGYDNDYIYINSTVPFGAVVCDGVEVTSVEAVTVSGDLPNQIKATVNFARSVYDMLEEADASWIDYLVFEVGQSGVYENNNTFSAVFDVWDYYNGFMTISYKSGYGISVVATNGFMNAYFDSQTNKVYIKDSRVASNKYMVGARNVRGTLSLSGASSLPSGAVMAQINLGMISGYDNTKTQTLKNVQGVLTWVDDPA